MATKIVNKTWEEATHEERLTFLIEVARIKLEYRRWLREHQRSIPVAK